MHKTMVSIASLEKIEIIRSQEFMVSEARLKFLKKLPFWGLNFVEFWCWGLIFGDRGGARAPGAPPPGSAPDVSLSPVVLSLGLLLTYSS